MPDFNTVFALAIEILVWLGTPALILVPMTLVIFVIDWAKSAASSTPSVGAGYEERSFRRNVREKPIVFVVFVLVEGALVALIHSGFRLWRAMTIADASGRNIADGKSFTWGELWTNLTHYTDSDELAMKALWITVGWLLVLNLANLFGIRFLSKLLTLPMLPIVYLSAFAALGIGAVGLMVLANATVFEAPGYNVEMVSLYAFWVLILGGIGVTVPIVTGLADGFYDMS